MELEQFGNRILCCLTHPDDEISICALLRRLTNSGREVFLSYTHSTGVRSAEALRVAELLGVPHGQVFFHDGPDGDVCEHLGLLLPRFRQMVAEVRPDSVLCGAFEQGHLDHDSTCFLVHQVFPGPIFEVPFYYWYRFQGLQRFNEFSDPRSSIQIDLDSEEQGFKKRVAQQYPSQNIWILLMLYNLITRKALYRRELIRPSNISTFHEPTHPSKLSSRIRRHWRWKRWIAALESFENGSLN